MRRGDRHPPSPLPSFHPPPWRKFRLVDSKHHSFQHLHLIGVLFHLTVLGALRFATAPHVFLQPLVLQPRFPLRSNLPAYQHHRRPLLRAQRLWNHPSGYRAIFPVSFVLTLLRQTLTSWWQTAFLGLRRASGLIQTRPHYPWL